MSRRRIRRLNSLLKEVISDVIRKEVKNPCVSNLISVTDVDISNDLKHAKVLVSVIGDEKERRATIDALQSASGFISIKASQQVVMRFFPSLRFSIDDSAEKQTRIEELIKNIKYSTDDESPE